MKKTIILFVACLLMTTSACMRQTAGYNKVTIAQQDSVKQVLVEISYTDTLYLEVPNSVSDSLILESIKELGDSLRTDSIRRDSLHRINFRRITKLINGGYNGHAEREAIWIKAKQVLR